MNFGTKLQYQCPDSCPWDCLYKDDLIYGQNSICTRCPVVNCREMVDPDGEIFCLVPPEHFRDDWAAEWHIFFKFGHEPELWMIPQQYLQVCYP